MVIDGVFRVRRAEQADYVAATEVLLRSRHASVAAIPPLVHLDEEAKKHFAQTMTESIYCSYFESCTLCARERAQEQDFEVQRLARPLFVRSRSFSLCCPKRSLNGPKPGALARRF